MQNVKLANGLLWVFNGLFAAGILAFAGFYLIRDSASLKGFAFNDGAELVKESRTGGDDRILKTLPNPLEKTGPGPESVSHSFPALLKGTIPAEKDPRNRAAFIKSKTRNFESVAFMGEDIRDGERICEEFRGWKLVEVGKDWATFSNGVQKATLTLDPSAPPTPVLPGAGSKLSRIGGAYESKNFKSRLASSDPNRLVYELDPEEIEWAMQNQDSIMNDAFTVSPSASGGIRIDTVQSTSIGAARGLAAGDIIKDVNGQSLRSVEDVKSMMTSPAMRAQTGMRITVERAGRPVVIEYRPMVR